MSVTFKSMILRTNRGIATDITKDSAMDFTSPSSHTRLKQEHDEKKQTHHQFMLLLLSFHGYVQFQRLTLFFVDISICRRYCLVCLLDHSSLRLFLSSSTRFVWLVCVGPVGCGKMILEV